MSTLPATLPFSLGSQQVPGFVDGVTGAVLQVRDSGGVRVAQVDDFTALEMVLRFNGVSSWVLDLPADTGPAHLLREPGYGLVVERDGVVLMSGPVRETDRTWDDSGDRLTVAGVSDDVWLARRLALPVPGGDFSLSAYDVRTGLAETVIRQYVDVNVGPSAQVDRQKVVLSADLGRGTSVTGRARFDQLDELLRELALAGGDLGFRVVDVDGTLTFEVYVRKDRSGSAVFSPQLGNLASFQLRTSAPEGTAVYVGGDGEGSFRTVVKAESVVGAARWGLLETFVDGGASTDTAELEQKAADTLAEAAQPASLSLTPVDTDGVKFGRDYQLGDTVTVEVDGVPVVESIRQLTVTYGSDGEVVKPAVTAGSGTVLRLLERLRTTERRIGRQERQR